MALKQLQLRGISRTPSDRMTEDGGVAESLNFQLEDQESAPMIQPEEDERDINGDVIFIHKGSGYENYIVLNGSNVYALGVNNNTPFITDATSDIKMASLGNIIKFLYNSKSTSVLFKEGQYRLLGGTIPFPELKFKETWVTTSDEETIETTAIAAGSEQDTTDPDGYFKWLAVTQFREKYWNDEQKQILSTDMRYDWLVELKACIGKVNVCIDNLASHYDAYVRPLFARYSIVLYDGTEIVSDPYFLGIRQDAQTASVEVITREAVGENVFNEDRWPVKINVALESAFKIKITRDTAGISVLNELKDTWGDIVTGVRVYLSQDINAKKIDSYTGCYLDRDTIEMHYATQAAEHGGLLYLNKAFLNVEDPVLDKEEVLSKSTFNLVNEFTLEDLISADKDIDYYNNTNRAVKSLLKESIVQSKNEYVPKGIKEYNGRFLSYDMTTTPYSGMGFPAGMLMSGAKVNTNVDIYYFIRESLGNTVSARRLGLPWTNQDTIASYLYYPDPNCYKAVLHMGDNWFEITMKEHPILNGAYFLDTDTLALVTLLTKVVGGQSHSYVKKLTGVPTFGEQVIKDRNKLYQTSSSNFYLYENAETMGGDILGLTVNTQALSAGQYGQHPIIVYTADGLFAISVSETGSLSRVDPLPRAVAIEGKMWQIDNAAVFITDRGVNIISGSEIEDISPRMNGKHYVIEECASEVIEATEDWAGYVDILEDDTVFIDFMKKAEMSYDYAGSRLIFFSDEDYAYVYMLKTKSWHKLSIPAGKSFLNTLNSYPESVVVFKKSDSRQAVTEEVCTITAGTNSGTMTTAQILQIFKGRGIIDGIGITEAEMTKFINNQRTLKLYGDKNVYIAPIYATLQMYGFGVTKTFADEITHYVDLDISKLYDYSTFYDGQSEEEVTAVIATRPFDLGLPDVLKTINHIRIRGLYSKVDEDGDAKVKYILLGSQDGLNFYRIKSLRGKSWKLFRMIILAKLKPTERISWVDIDYEPRFTNKLR